MSDHSSDDLGEREDADTQLNGGNDADLFGSGSENEEDAGDKPRKLSDEELDSGDDESRREDADDNASETKEPTYTRQENVLDVSIGRHAIPQPSDCEVISLRPFAVCLQSLMIGIASFAIVSQLSWDRAKSFHSKRLETPSFRAPYH